MATRNVNVGTVPMNIVTALPLTVGRRYALQNVDANARIFVRGCGGYADRRGGCAGMYSHRGSSGYPEPDGVTGIWLPN